jgi:hypothetical protein
MASQHSASLKVCNRATELLALLLRIQEMPGLELGPVTSYHEMTSVVLLTLFAYMGNRNLKQTTITSLHTFQRTIFSYQAFHDTLLSQNSQEKKTLFNATTIRL